MSFCLETSRACVGRRHEYALESAARTVRLPACCSRMQCAPVRFTPVAKMAPALRPICCCFQHPDYCMPPLQRSRSGKTATMAPLGMRSCVLYSSTSSIVSTLSGSQTYVNSRKWLRFGIFDFGASAPLRLAAIATATHPCAMPPYRLGRWARSLRGASLPAQHC